MSLFLRYEDMWDRALGGTTDEKQIPHWFANFAYVLIGFVFKVLFRYRVDGRENLRAFKTAAVRWWFPTTRHFWTWCSCTWPRARASSCA